MLMISTFEIIEIFCILNDFIKEFETVLTRNSISNTSSLKIRKRKSKMSKKEVMTIRGIFHLKSYLFYRFFSA